MKVAGRKPHMVMEDIEEGEMNHFVSARIRHMELDECQEGPKMRSRCGSLYCRNMNAQIGPRGGSDCLGREKGCKKIEA